MGRLDLPDPVRDEDIWLSAHTICQTRDCATPGCDQDARASKKLCGDCAKGQGQLGLRLLMGQHAELDFKPVKREASPSVTPAELLVVQCAAGGMSTRETASHLGKRHGTIKQQISSAKRRLAVATVDEAIEILTVAGVLQ